LRKPDLEGPGLVKAWRLSTEMSGLSQATVAAWLVNHPMAHRMWDYWLVTVTHLRPEPGYSPPQKQFESAQYELVISAVDLDYWVSPEKGPYRLLQPVDVLHQFDAGLGDEEAEEVCRLAAAEIVAGHIGPDQEDRVKWDHLFPKILNQVVERT